MVRIEENLLIRDIYVPGFEPIFTPLIKERNPSIEFYKSRGGYTAIRKVLGMRSEEVIEMVKASGLRGRGGAGFPTGLKWSFIPREAPKKYIVCNADEGEPLTFKDRYLLAYTPHLVIEGILISAYAIGSDDAIIYIRGEYFWEGKIVERAVEEARKEIKELGLNVNLRVMMGAGAYIVGEETGMLNSIEGKRGTPRSKPPFPATKGLRDMPTVINNVETLASLPFIVNRGADWFKSIGTPKSTGPKLFCVSGDVKNPGIYELPLGFPLWELIKMAEPIDGVKGVIPGGTSTPVLTAEEAKRATLDFESIASFGSFLGTGGVFVIGEGRDILCLALNISRFYAEESCGQCTTCREGSKFIEYLLERIANGAMDEKNFMTLYDVSSSIIGSAICAHVDAASMPIKAILEKYKFV